jgi:hypothetical protein
MSKKKLHDSEERIQELEDLYVLTRDQFLDEYEDIRPAERAKIIQQLRGMLDDIAKEAGGRVKRQEIANTFGTKDSSFLELIAGIRGNLPEPQPVIDIQPLEIIDGTERATEETAAEE